MSIPLSLIYILMWASVVVMGTFTIASIVTGFCLVTTINIAGIIPYIPYFPALIIGISCFGLAILSAIGTYYMSIYIARWFKVMSDGAKILPTTHTIHQFQNILKFQRNYQQFLNLLQ